MLSRKGLLDEPLFVIVGEAHGLFDVSREIETFSHTLLHNLMVMGFALGMLLLSEVLSAGILRRALKELRKEREAPTGQGRPVK